MRHCDRTIRSILILMFVGGMVFAQEKGTAYIMYGSDTAIWDGISTSRRHPSYDLSLFTSTTGNAARVMSPDFRHQILDSDRTPLPAGPRRALGAVSSWEPLTTR